MANLPVILQCRICLGDFEESQMMCLFKGKGESDLRQKLELCCRIRVRQSPQLPEKACNSCCEFVQMWFNFRQMCLNSQVYWETSSSERPEALAQASDAEYMEYLYENLHLKLGTENQEQDEITAIEEGDEQLEDQSQEVLDFNGFIINESIEQDEEPITESPVQMLISHMDSYVDDQQMEELIDDKSELIEDLSNANEYYEVEYRDEQLLLSSAPSPQPSFKMDKQKPGRPRKPDAELKFKRKDINAKERGNQSKCKDDEKYICILCGNVYFKKSVFTAHMMTHSEYKPHQCEICNKSFRQMGELRAHIRRHTGDRPYKCLYCDRHFYDRSERVRHERVHTNTRPYACQECGKTFTHTAILKNHILSHSDQKNYNCGICCKSFTLLHQLKAHMQTLTHRNKLEQSILSSPEVLES